jgi:hypothetical protein
MYPLGMATDNSPFVFKRIYKHPIYMADLPAGHVGFLEGTLNHLPRPISFSGLQIAILLLQSLLVRPKLFQLLQDKAGNSVESACCPPCQA